MISIQHKGTLKNTFNFLNKNLNKKYEPILNRYGSMGVKYLSSATPVDTGKTSKSWTYKIKYTNKGFELGWYNSSTADGVPIVILLQYGHGTKNGGYVRGVDYINPAIKPVMEKLQKELWMEVTK